MGYLVEYFGYFQGYLLLWEINYGDICQFIRDTCLFTSRDMGYLVPPIHASLIQRTLTYLFNFHTSSYAGTNVP